MLYEIAHIKQWPGEPVRRWFTDDYFDLVVWFDPCGGVIRFQLSYDKRRYQRALTWETATGYMHSRVEDGEERPGRLKSSPVLLVEGEFDKRLIADRFQRSCADLQEDTAVFIYDRILAYPEPSFKEDARKSIR